MSVMAIKHFFSPAWEYMRARSAGGQLEGMTLSSMRSASLHNWFFGSSSCGILRMQDCLVQHKYPGWDISAITATEFHYEINLCDLST